MSEDNKKLFVGNLNFRTTEDDLASAFAQGDLEVTSVIMPTDRETGRPRGFAFIEMATEEMAQAAIEAWDGNELDGRTLRVNVAQPRENRGGGGGGGRGGYGGGGGGYGGGGGGYGGGGGGRGGYGGGGGRGGYGGGRDRDRGGRGGYGGGGGRDRGGRGGDRGGW